MKTKKSQKLQTEIGDIVAANLKDFYGVKIVSKQNNDSDNYNDDLKTCICFARINSKDMVGLLGLVHENAVGDKYTLLKYLGNDKFLEMHTQSIIRYCPEDEFDNKYNNLHLGSKKFVEQLAEFEECPIGVKRVLQLNSIVNYDFNSCKEIMYNIH